MIEKGTVISTQGQDATVRFYRKKSCEKCGMCAFTPMDTHIDMTLKNTVSAKDGDFVEVDITGGAVIKTALIVYLMPLLLALVGMFGAFLFGWEEYVAFLLFGGMLTVGYCIVYFIDKFVGKRKTLVPKIVKLLEKE